MRAATLACCVPKPPTAATPPIVSRPEISYFQKLYRQNLFGTVTAPHSASPPAVVSYVQDVRLDIMWVKILELVVVKFKITSRINFSGHWNNEPQGIIIHGCVVEGSGSRSKRWWSNSNRGAIALFEPEGLKSRKWHGRAPGATPDKRGDRTVFMPPKWALGYHQCRWGYDSEARVREIAKTFRQKGMPCDVIWMDIDYMDGYRCFTFDQACSYSINFIYDERFPDPKTLVAELHQAGFKAIWMLDPGIKREEGYFVYDSGSERDIWIQTADGKPFVGDVWPGPCVFPDFAQSRTRSWWADLVKDFISNGVDGIWNDMNEPAVFKTVTKTMPESNVHHGDIEFGGCQNHLHYHNVYGMLMARSTYEGMKLANENGRPFVLTRAGFIGSQRYAATWTGDNLSLGASSYEYLNGSPIGVLSGSFRALSLHYLGLSGQPLSGPDIG
ncbi:unnamed protein product, partial [Thlaspi arvense]